MFYSDSDILTLHQELVLHMKSFLVEVESTSVVTRVGASQITAPTGLSHKGNIEISGFN